MPQPAYPTGLMTKIAQAMFGNDAKGLHDEYRTKAYVMGQAAAARANEAQANKYNEEAMAVKRETEALNDPDTALNAVFRMLGISENMQPHLKNYMKTGSTRYQTAAEIPEVPGYYAPKIENDRKGVEVFGLSDGVNFSVVPGSEKAFPIYNRFTGQEDTGYEQSLLGHGAPTISMDTRNFVPGKPAVPAQYAELDPAMLKQFNALLGSAMMGRALTGKTNTDELMNAVTERLRQDAIYSQPPVGDEVLSSMQRAMQLNPGSNPMEQAQKAQELHAVSRALMGNPINPQAMALMRANPLFSGGHSNYTDAVTESERFREHQANLRNNADNATSRRNTDVSQQTERWKHTTPGANRAGEKEAKEESNAINALDLALPIVPQVPLTDPDYAQFARLYNQANAAGDMRMVRNLLHRALQHGLVRQGK